MGTDDSRSCQREVLSGQSLDVLLMGQAFGAPTQGEVELAELVSQRVPSIEKLRLVSSGTEATMSAIRLARAFTNRSKLVKFDGCYHGHSDGLLVKSGSGVATLSLPDSPGVPASIARETLTAKLQRFTVCAKIISSLRQRYCRSYRRTGLRQHGGDSRLKPDFLDGLRKITTRQALCLSLMR